MRISSRFAATGLSCVFAAVLIGAALVQATNRIAEELKENRAAAGIVEKVSGLRYLTLEYARQPEKRVEMQWATAHGSLATLLASGLGTGSGEEQASFQRIREAHRDVAPIFHELVEAQRARQAGEGNREVLDELVRRLTTAVVNKTLVMMTEAFRLQDVSRDAVSVAQRDAFVTIVSLSALLALVVAMSMFLAFRSISRPLARLREGTELVGAGNLNHAIRLAAQDEIGDLAREFDQMTVKLKTITVSRDRLVQSEAKLQAQLERLDLLRRITRAIGERQDLHSILQVCVRSLEESLPIDFGCVGLYDPLPETLTIGCVSVRSEALALELGMPKSARVAIDQNGLSRCVAGNLVYEPDLEEVPFPFSQRLARAGLRSLIVAPLLVESRVFGVLVAARHAPQAFSSGECEFLRQLSEHVALAAHQAEIHEELQRAYEDLRQTQHAVMQQERLRALGEMASGIAHDINNAISPIAVYVDLLLDREATMSQTARGQLQVMQRAIGDVEQTLARMREFYRPHEPQLALAPIQVNDLVRQVMDLARARWSDMPQQRGIVIEPRMELASELPIIMGVESEIREALTNLVFNAVDAMPEGGALRMHTAASADAADVYVDVGDTGVGMDEDTRRRCMEPFFTTKGARGTGMGLAMVYGVVQRHSADIAIDSTLGTGTTVRLTFPSRSAAVTDSLELGETPLMQARMRILVVDDDPLLLKSLRDILEADGHFITSANGGREGIEVFSRSCQRGEPFPVVITDLGMPYVDGRTVARAVKTQSANTAVILLTGWGQRLVSDGEVPAHVDHVLSKPPKLRVLREALAKCCAPAGRAPNA